MKIRRNMSAHASIDRYDRLEYIIDTIGLGEPCMSAPSLNAPSRMEVVTTTGVIIVQSTEYNTGITAFIGSIDKITALYQSTGNKIPKALYRKIISNLCYLKNQPQTIEIEVNKNWCQV